MLLLPQIQHKDTIYITVWFSTFISLLMPYNSSKWTITYAQVKMFTTSVINKNAYINVFIYSTVITHQYFFIIEAHTFLGSKSSHSNYICLEYPLQQHFRTYNTQVYGWSREVYIDVFFNNLYFPLFSVCVLFKMYHNTVGCLIIF